MKNILLPTDFSKNSWNAITYALHLFRDKECTFHLLNMYTPVIYHVEYVLGYPAQFGLGDVARNTSQNKLKKLSSKIVSHFGKNPNHKFETSARFDSLISGIKELIVERQIDCIIMGTKGATGAKEILFGSNTVQVFKEIKCPILAIPSDYKYDAPHDLLFPTDLEVNFKNSQLPILQEIVELHNSSVNAMHVATGYELTEIQQNNKLELESMFNTTDFLFHEVEDMEISEAINTFQMNAKTNFLVMINNKHSFFENVFFKNTINHIGIHLNIPFMVIPSN